MNSPIAVDVPVIIYQMGKVGSTSVYNSIKPIHPLTFQVHSLVPEKLNKTISHLTSKGLGVPKHVKLSRSLLDTYLSKRLPVKIITPIRSPLRRNVSAFFQELSTLIVLNDQLRASLFISPKIKWLNKALLPNEWKNLFLNYYTKRNIAAYPDVILDYFIQNYRHNIPLAWFKNEFQRVTDINVFEHTFDSTIGSIRIDRQPIDVLIFKTELSNKVKTELIRNFIGMPIPTLVNAHQSKRKTYSASLSQFKNEIRFDEYFIERIKSSPYVQQFYPGEELWP